MVLVRLKQCFLATSNLPFPSVTIWQFATGARFPSPTEVLPYPSNSQLHCRCRSLILPWARSTHPVALWQWAVRWQWPACKRPRCPKHVALKAIQDIWFNALSGVVGELELNIVGLLTSRYFEFLHSRVYHRLIIWGWVKTLVPFVHPKIAGIYGCSSH